MQYLELGIIMSEVKKCSKCGGELALGILSVEGGTGWEINWRLRKRKLGENIVASRCRQCGYIELYSTNFPQGEG
jgi:predicted nucleic-acid-binding Zn-ribbon protein